jgi:hypothetical protein
LIVLAALLAAAAAVLFFLRSRPRARRAARARASATSSDSVPALRGDASSSSPSLARHTPAPSARTRRCPKCGASYPESSAFCGSDGSALTSPE